MSTNTNVNININMNEFGKAIYKTRQALINQMSQQHYYDSVTKENIISLVEKLSLQGHLDNDAADIIKTHLRLLGHEEFVIRTAVNSIHYYQNEIFQSLVKSETLEELSIRRGQSLEKHRIIWLTKDKAYDKQTEQTGQTALDMFIKEYLSEHTISEADNVRLEAYRYFGSNCPPFPYEKQEVWSIKPNGERILICMAI